MAEPTLNIYPTLIIGLGGAGTNTVRLVKRRFLRTWNTLLATRRAELERWNLPTDSLMDADTLPPLLQVMAVDTEPRVNKPLDEPLYYDEFAYLGRFDATKLVVNKDQHRPWLNWWQWGPADITPGFIHTGARQLRPIGRLAFFRHYVTFKKMLEDKLASMYDVSAKETAQEHGADVTGTTKCVIYIVSSLCGGTGAGMFLDAAHVVRQYANKKFGDKGEVYIAGVLLMPSVFENEVRSDIQRRRIRANAYASLKELNYFHTHPGEFGEWYPSESERIPTTPHRAFSNIYLLERDDMWGRTLASKAGAEQMAAHLVHVATFSTLNTTLYGQEVNVAEEKNLSYSAFGASALVMPQEALWRYFVAQTAGWALSHFFEGDGGWEALQSLHDSLIGNLLVEFSRYNTVEFLDHLNNDMSENTGNWTRFESLFNGTMQEAIKLLYTPGVGVTLMGIHSFLEQFYTPEEQARPGQLTYPGTAPCKQGLQDVPRPSVFGNIFRPSVEVQAQLEKQRQEYNHAERCKVVWPLVVTKIQELARNWDKHLEQIYTTATNTLERVQAEARRAAIDIDPRLRNRDRETNTYYDLETGAVAFEHLPNLMERARQALDEKAQEMLVQRIYEQLQGQVSAQNVVATDFTQLVRHALQSIPGLQERVYEQFSLKNLVHLQRRSETRQPNDRVDQLFGRLGPHAAVDGDTHDYHEGVQEHIHIASVPYYVRNGADGAGVATGDGASQRSGNGVEDVAFTQALKSYKEFTTVHGTESERIDLLHLMHGLPVSQLSSIPDLYAQYMGPTEAPPGQTLDEMQANREFTPRLLHLNPDYAPGEAKALPELYVPSTGSRRTPPQAQSSQLVQGGPPPGWAQGVQGVQGTPSWVGTAGYSSVTPPQSSGHQAALPPVQPSSGQPANMGVGTGMNANANVNQGTPGSGSYSPPGPGNVGAGQAGTPPGVGAPGVPNAPGAPSTDPDEEEWKI
ncbi:MAG TPA: tubulin-like doman-containing protein [Chloroflexia bacterium]|nr:tubulin-like doman-containing protein [Chloroflexia bacterium]